MAMLPLDTPGAAEDAAAQQASRQRLKLVDEPSATEAAATPSETAGAAAHPSPDATENTALPPLPSLLLNDDSLIKRPSITALWQQKLLLLWQQRSRSPVDAPEEAAKTEKSPESISSPSLTHQMRQWLAEKGLYRFRHRWLFAALAAAVLTVHALMLYVIDQAESPSRPAATTVSETADSPSVVTSPEPLDDRQLLEWLKRR